jgi:hypothetical protein
VNWVSVPVLLGKLPGSQQDFPCTFPLFVDLVLYILASKLKAGSLFHCKLLRSLLVSFLVVLP